MLVLCGYSGSGKDSILSKLVDLGLEPIVPYTTRNKRWNEKEDITYHFISEEEFQNLKKQRFFAETTSFDTINGRKYYGTATEDIADDKVVILNPKGVEQLKKRKDINITVVYIECEESVLRHRLDYRGDNEEEINRRLEADKHDFSNIKNICDMTIINNGTHTVKDIAKTIYFFYKEV
jgi:guanylate kinase